jgi:hypothetical protein
VSIVYFSLFPLFSISFFNSFFLFFSVIGGGIELCRSGNCYSRIVLHRRNDQLTKVAETHRCYDALQYPVIFWDGADGYHFNVKMINPVSGAWPGMASY